MSGREVYEQVPLSDMRSQSAISDISDAGRDTLRPNARHDVSPMPSPSLSAQSLSGVKSHDRNITQVSLISSTTNSGHKIACDDAHWLPITLRTYLIWVPTAIALICGLVIMSLYWYSNKNNGLSPATTAIFGWKFIPTFIAVIYTQLTTILFDDVKRTEPFARMARPAGSIPNASHTILETPRAWWTTLAHGFQKKRNGGQRSWVLVMACLVNVVAFLAISPLSSALLDVQTLRVTRPIEMARLVPKQDKPLKLVDDRNMYSRITAALLQNVTTSPWITKEYAILPFWPMESPDAVWNGPSLQAPRKWRAETTVFHNEFKCSNLSLAATSLGNPVKFEFHTPESVLTVRLDGLNGCQYNISLTASDANIGRISWTDSNHIADKFSFNSLAEDRPPLANDKCQGNEAIILSTPWTDFDKEKENQTTQFLSNMTSRGYMCSSEVSMATIEVDASVSETTFHVSFDETRFHNVKSAVTDKFLNLTDLLRVSTDPQWYEYIPSMAGGAQGEFSGLAALLATQNDLNATRMLQDQELDRKAAYIRRRLFGELLRSSVDAPGASKTETVSAKSDNFERRVRVSVEAAALLAGLFFVSFLMLMYITWFSRLTQRPLNLAHDPATVLGTACLVANSAEVLSSLRGLDQATAPELMSALGENVYSTSPGVIHEDAVHRGPAGIASSSRNTKAKPDQTPSFLKIWTLVGLLVYLAALLAALAVVHHFATRSSLRQSLFTYRVSSDIFGSFAPFSIIPTVLGIGLGLWWNGMDKSFRQFQPYLAMSRTPIKVARGAGISYQSSYWLLASSKAAKNNHWLLALVTLGTFLAQAFIIAMSALFELNTGLINSQISLDRSLEIRQTPHLGLGDSVYPPVFDGVNTVFGFEYVETTLQDLFTNLTTNWMYSAFIQATLNGSEPAWSKDGWSFVPLNLSGVDTLRENYQQDDPDIQAAFKNYSPINITVKTPALRARLECSPTDDVTNTSWWLTPSQWIDSANNTVKLNRLEYVWKFNVSEGSDDSEDSGDFGYQTPIAPDAQITQCCFNQSEPSRMDNFTMSLAVGYWTSNFGKRYGERSVTGDNGNFTVKWIHGEGGFGAYSGASIRPPIMFQNATGLQSLNCMPIIESSEAEITVDQQTQRVHSFTILKDAVPEDGAWSDNFVLREPYDRDDPDFQAQLTSSFDKDPYYPNTSHALLNITTSYGILFTEALLRASRLASLDSLSTKSLNSVARENLVDNVFNIRNNLTGLNLDFMSYASYVRAGADAAALLDQDALMRRSNATFSLFFQHYVSNSVSLKTGGWAFQPIGAKMEDLRGFTNGTFRQIQPGGKAAVKVEDLPSRNTEPTATATMTTRVEVLTMNREAFWVCLVILCWLVLTVLIVVALHRRTFKELDRNIASIADTLVLIAGSERLLAALREHGVQGLMSADVKTRLGWFRASDGNMRRGIEIVRDGEVVIK